MRVSTKPFLYKKLIRTFYKNIIRTLYLKVFFYGGLLIRMVKKSRLILMFSLILLVFLMIGTVSAADNTTLNNSNSVSSSVDSESVNIVNLNTSINDNQQVQDYQNMENNGGVADNTVYSVSSNNTNNVNNDEINILGSSNDEVSVLGNINDNSNIVISPNGTNNGTGTQEDPTDYATAYTSVVDGGTITFLNGEYTNIVNMSINKNITLYHDATIGEAIINPNGTGYIFYLNSNTSLVVNGLKMVNATGYTIGSHTYGGAIYAENNCTIMVINSTFTNNTARNGGAIRLTTGNLTSINSTFTNNTAANDDGGAIRLDTGNVTSINSTFTNNTASSGGAILLGTGNVTSINSTFTNNTAYDGGGAIWLGTGNLTSINSTFTNNTANGDYGGGAILLGTGNLTSINSTFTNNTAASCGGAIQLFSTGNLTVSGSIFLDNAAVNGSAIYIGTDSNVVADYDWWGNNTPFNGTNYNNLIYHKINDSDFEYLIPNNWVVMGLTVDPSVILLGGNSSVIVSLNQTMSTSGVVSPLPSSIVLPARVVIFNTSNGILNLTSTNISGSVVNVYTPSSTGTYTLSSTIDNQNLSTIITVNGGETPTSKGTSIVESVLSVYENGTVIVHVLDDGSVVDVGSVNLLYDNSAVGTGYVRDGVATFKLTNLTPGNYNVTVFYFGKSPFNSCSKTLTLTVLPDNSNVTINVPNISGKAGANQTVIINVTDSLGNPVNTGNITISINGINYTGNVVNGSAQINYTVPSTQGVHNITVTYTNGTYTTSVNSTINVTNNTSSPVGTVLIGYNLTKNYGTLANYTGKLTDTNGNPIVGQHIALNLTRLDTGKSKVYWVTTDTHGEYQLEINLWIANYTASASYAGNDYYKPANTTTNTITVTGNVTGTVLTADTFNEKFNAGKNFTGKLTDTNGNPIVGQHIALNLTRLDTGKSKVYWVTTDTHGEYQLAINLWTANYTAHCSYTGTSSYSSSSASATITVN